MWSSVLPALLVIGSATSFEHGDRYWNGRPQPIGIDFSYNGAVAVYADSPRNFTRLAAAFPPADHDYVQYQFKIFESWNNHWWDGMIINDFPSDSWTIHVPSFITAGYETLRSKSCSNFLGQFSSYHKFCYPEDYEHSAPRKPKSKYQALIFQIHRQGRIQNLMPKWFRTTAHAQPPTSANFVSSIVDILETLKAMSLKEHNITIYSAIIARPQWAINEIGDLFEEACLLADIETFEQPRSRNQVAAKTAEPGGDLMVLNHGYHYLTAHQFEWRESEGHCETGSMQFPGLGGASLLQTLGNILVSNHNHNVTEVERDWPSHINLPSFWNEVANGFNFIKNATTWLESAEQKEIFYQLNIADAIGRERMINITVDDVARAEKTYIDAVASHIDMHLTKNEEVYKYHLAQNPNFSFNQKSDDELQAIVDNIKANVTPPVEIGSWYTHVNQTILLSSEPEAYLVVNAVGKAIGWDAVGGARNMCFSPWRDVAAQGAALRAIEWRGYYDAEERDAMLYKCWEEGNYEGECYDPIWDDEEF